MTWSVKGQYFEACNCEAACPCVFLSPPTDGNCTVLVGWHIEEGEFEGTTLDGLNVSMAVYSPGHMAEVQWQAALYFDDRASDAQSSALAAIFSGQAGGHPERLASHIGEVLGAGPASIEFEKNGKRRSMKISGIADVAITAEVGQGEGDITIEGHPLAIVPGVPVVVSRSEHFTYDDHGMQWNLTEKNGFYSPFTYSA
ncbi:MAG: DUF1326 domain-containing protein [Actinomycetota bacterium]|nr:DUF1326 domain-containing protein [Actinomycetota bacterium]